MSRLMSDGDKLLEQLCVDTGALAAWVRDSASPRIWWKSPARPDAVTEATLDNLYHFALDENLHRPVRKGFKMRLCREEQAPYGFAYSFADIYLLVLAFSAPFERFVVEPRLRKMLLVLEKMIPLLPTIDGPGQTRSHEKTLFQIKPGQAE